VRVEAAQHAILADSYRLKDLNSNKRDTGKRASRRAAKLQAPTAREGDKPLQARSTETAERSFEKRLRIVGNLYDRQNNLRFGTERFKKLGHFVRLQPSSKSIFTNYQ